VNDMVKAVRGAVCLQSDTEGQVADAVWKLISRMLERNAIGEQDIVSIVFSQTKDIVSKNPAGALRNHGFKDIPLFCTQEPDYAGSLPMTIRVLLTCNIEKNRTLVPIYIDGAEVLREDLFS